MLRFARNLPPNNGLSLKFAESSRLPALHAKSFKPTHTAIDKLGLYKRIMGQAPYAQQVKVGGK